MLKQGVTLKVKPIDDDELGDIDDDSASWELDMDVYDVQILERRSDQVVVVVPGYGTCAVASDASTPAKTASSDTKQIISLSLCFECVENEECAGIPDFLRQIGTTPLTCLSIDAYIGRFTSIPAIIHSCPNLKTLIVKNSTISTDAFLRVYSLSQLCLEDLESRFDDAIPLMEELSDMTKRI